MIGMDEVNWMDELKKPSTEQKKKLIGLVCEIRLHFWTQNLVRHCCIT